MHYVGSVDWSIIGTPAPASATASGLSRRVIVGPEEGATHTELAIGALSAGGWIARHVHAYEEAFYVLEGELVLELDGRLHRLAAGHFALLTIGTPHALAAEAPVRWLAVSTPPRRDPALGGAPDTVFATAAPDIDAMLSMGMPPDLGDPSVRYVGRYAGTPPQLEALAIRDAARGRAVAGIDTALLAYSGISVKMLVDRTLGADLLTMFTVDYEVGGAAQSHAHPFEETYFYLEGECQAELDGRPYTLRAGDVIFAGVDSVHGFWNDGPGRVRWIETQAPQPPARNSYRWEPTWRRVAERGIEPWRAPRTRG